MENNKKELILEEIKKLKKLKSKWNIGYPDKEDVRNLLQELNKFNYFFSSQYIYAIPYFKKNSSAEVDITDGIEALQQYSKSNLKTKDDQYFYKGIENIQLGLNSIISSLERIINSKVI
jgi:hypothetical protein